MLKGSRVLQFEIGLCLGAHRTCYLKLTDTLQVRYGFMLLDEPLSWSASDMLPSIWNIPWEQLTKGYCLGVALSDLRFWSSRIGPVWSWSSFIEPMVLEWCSRTCYPGVVVLVHIESGHSLIPDYCV